MLALWVPLEGGCLATQGCRTRQADEEESTRPAMPQAKPSQAQPSPAKPSQAQPSPAKAR